MLRAYFCMYVILQQKIFGYFLFEDQEETFPSSQGVDIVIKVHSTGLTAWTSRRITET